MLLKHIRKEVMKMIFKRLLSLTAAAVFALSSFSVLAFADDEEEEEEAIEFTYDESYLTDTKEPALSFDGSAFSDYIHLTRDAGVGGISFEQDKDTYYQGNSLVVYASTSGCDGYFSCSGMVRDDNNNLLYPDAPDAEETDDITIIGIELHAEDFGLSCFDGCLINFAYRLTEEDTALLDSSVWVFSANEDNVRQVNSPTQLEINTLADNNISQYQTNGLLSVPADSSSTKIIFEIPTQGSIDAAVLYLDNITISLPDTVEDYGYVANVDSYNASAEPREGSDELKISKTTSLGDTTSEVEKSSDGISPAIIIVIIVIVLIVAAAVFFIIRKTKNRFY